MVMVQRLPKACMVTVLSLLLLGGTTGMVAAAGEPDLPSTFMVPMPQAGDRWQYDLEAVVHEESSDVELATQRVVYAWEEARPFQDAAGKWHVVHGLQEWNATDGEAMMAYLVDAASGQVVGIRSDNSTGEHGVFGGIAGIGSGSRTHRAESVVTLFEQFPTICGLRSSLQGQDVPLDRPVPFQGWCSLEAEAMEELGAPLGIGGQMRAERVDTVDNIPTVVFHAADRTVVEEGEFALDLRLWMSPAIPYPVRAEYRFAFDLVLEGETFHFAVTLAMRMTGFDPGTDGWGAVVLPEGPVPSIVVAPRQPWGPDDSGLDMPFRAREAWAMAKADEDAGPWFEDHPGAAAIEGTFDQMEFADRIERTWTLLVAEGRDAAWIKAVQVQWKGEAWTLLDQFGVDDPAGVVAGQATGAGGVTLEEVRLQDDIELPAWLPAVRTVQDRWLSMLQDEGPANGYAFALWGDDRVEAGRIEGSDDTPAVNDPVDPAPSTMRRERSVLVVDAAGLPIALEESVEEDQRREKGLLEPAAGPQDAATGEPGEVHSLSAPWTFPSAPAAASVAAGAFLIGLVYWLWPFIKSGGAVGLFSRVRRDELLEHPVRRSIHDAVHANPGIHYQQLIRTVGKGRGTVEHHLRKLQDGGYLVAHRNSGHTCFFVKGAIDHSVMAAVPAIRTEAAARVLACIQAQPGIRASDLAHRLGLARSTASHHVRRLKEAGLVEDAAGALLPSRLAQPALAAVAA